ncbi:MAG: c-type cytochrome [Bacteroidales bacterium]|jgi:mono/diheme cytochrome c family protein|nr:c-type cytochrome [Bacteroidales bacterium]
MKNSVTFFILILFVVGLSSCNKDQNNPGYTFYPDMQYSQAYETYTTNPVFADGYTNLAPAEGTIPRGYMPYPYHSKSTDEQIKAGLELTNPLEATDAVLAEGKRQYDIFCISCHGDAGLGDGHLYTSGLFPAKPTSLVEGRVKDLPDGEIYHVITLGSVSGLMGAHGSQVRPENRWKIIHYVRSITK